MSQLKNLQLSGFDATISGGVEWGRGNGEGGCVWSLLGAGPNTHEQNNVFQLV